MSVPNRQNWITAGLILVLLHHLLVPWSARAADIALPSLGDTSSGIISPQQEYELGQTWLQLYRSRVPTSSDPLLQDYTENLLHKLADHSQLRDRRLSLVVVNNPTINAFAVPGGVVGVHTGLFTNAHNEQEFAAVIAHELAHLSQRHYARGLEQARANAIPTMAGLLAGLILAATAGGDAGLAAMSATQAAARDAQLRFSRQNEQEADRIGMLTLAEADMDPRAMPAMFERLLRATRYSQRPPEFLLTHPITERRIADTRARAERFPQRYVPPSLDYHLMRARAKLALAETPQQAINRFESELEGDSLNAAASRYGLALAQRDASQFSAARQTLAPLREEAPDNLIYRLAEASIDTAAGSHDAAIAQLRTLRSEQPQRHPVVMAYADALMQAGLYTESRDVLAEHAERRPRDPHVWYLLAEVNGLAGDITGVHRARAEYFILNGVFDRAAEQLTYARKRVKEDTPTAAILEKRLADVRKMQEEAKL